MYSDQLDANQSLGGQKVGPQEKNCGGGYTPRCFSAKASAVFHRTRQISRRPPDHFKRTARESSLSGFRKSRSGVPPVPLPPAKSSLDFDCPAWHHRESVRRVQNRTEARSQEEKKKQKHETFAENKGPAVCSTCGKRGETCQRACPSLWVSI